MAENQVIQVNFGGTPFRELDDLSENLWTTIMQYDGRLPLMGVVGVLRLTEHRLLSQVHNEE